MYVVHLKRKCRNSSPYRYVDCGLLRVANIISNTQYYRFATISSKLHLDVIHPNHAVNKNFFLSNSFIQNFTQLSQILTSVRAIRLLCQAEFNFRQNDGIIEL